MERSSKKARVSVTGNTIITVDSEDDNDDETDDRLSSLPDAMLEHILSFLPTFDAVRTTILARRFRNLWTSVRTLSFYAKRFKAPVIKFNKYVGFVDGVLKLYKGPVLDKFEFEYLVFKMTRYLPVDEYRIDKKMICMTDDWVNWALCRDVKVLSLTFDRSPDGEPNDDYGPTDRVWHSESLVELYLFDYMLGSEIPVTVHMAALTTLTLEECGVEFEDFQRVISGCPVLDELTLNECRFVDLSFDAGNIRKLKVVSTYFVEQIYIINFPNLRSFVFEGDMYAFKWEDLSSLKNVTLNIEFSEHDNYGRIEDLLVQFQPFLEKTRHVLNMSLSTHLVAMFTCFMVKNIPYPFNCWKRLDLTVGVTENYIPGVYALLRNSPYLEELTLDLSRKTSRRLHPMIANVVNNLESGWLSNWISQVNYFLCLRQSLRNVTIIGYGKSTSAFVLRFVEILIKNALVLDKLVIKKETKSAGKDMMTYEEMYNFTRTLLAIPRASIHATILMP